jgi:hypothetical protein
MISHARNFCYIILYWWDGVGQFTYIQYIHICFLIYCIFPVKTARAARIVRRLCMHIENFEFLRKFKFICENAVAPLSGVQDECFKEKIAGSKIS